MTVTTHDDSVQNAERQHFKFNKADWNTFICIYSLKKIIHRSIWILSIADTLLRIVQNCLKMHSNKPNIALIKRTRVQWRAWKAIRNKKHLFTQRLNNTLKNISYLELVPDKQFVNQYRSIYLLLLMTSVQKVWNKWFTWKIPNFSLYMLKRAKFQNTKRSWQKFSRNLPRNNSNYFFLMI